MNQYLRRLRAAPVICCLAICLAQTPRIFDSGSDVGETPVKGKVEFNAATGEYRVTGGGANMWTNADAFQFAWKKMSGDMTISADVRFVGTGAVAHRKAAIMIRQGFETDAAYADAVMHGDGLTSLQSRPAAGGMSLDNAQKAKSDLSAPVHLRIERRGDTFTMFAGKPGEPATATGPVSVTLHDPVYVGLAVCSHKADVLETAIFSNVSAQALP